MAIVSEVTEYYSLQCVNSLRVRMQKYILGNLLQGFNSDKYSNAYLDRTTCPWSHCRNVRNSVGMLNYRAFLVLYIDIVDSVMIIYLDMFISNNNNRELYSQNKYLFKYIAIYSFWVPLLCLGRRKNLIVFTSPQTLNECFWFIQSGYSGTQEAISLLHSLTCQHRFH